MTYLFGTHCRAGAGAVPDLQSSGSAAVQDARNKVASNVEKTKKRIDKVFQSKVVNPPPKKPFLEECRINRAIEYSLNVLYFKFNGPLCTVCRFFLMMP
jgi:hypothetical protein